MGAHPHTPVHDGGPPPTPGTRAKALDSMITWAMKKIFGTSHEAVPSAAWTPKVEVIKPARRLRSRSSPTPSSGPRRRSSRRSSTTARPWTTSWSRRSRSCREGVAPRPQDAPLRRAAHRRHGAPQRLHRRDAHRRGQDAGRDPALLPERPRGQGRARRHGERLPRRARRRVDGQAVRLPRPDRRAWSSTSRATRTKRDAYRCDITLRPEQRVRLRLPARQHEVLGARVRAAPAALRDRGRGRLASSSTRRAPRSSSAARASGRATSTASINEIIPQLPQRGALRRRREGALGHAHRRGHRDGRAASAASSARSRARTSTTRSTSRRCTS